MPSSSSSTALAAGEGAYHSPLVAVSYPWLTKEHPDPKNFHTVSSPPRSSCCSTRARRTTSASCGLRALPQQDGEQEPEALFLENLGR